MPDCPTFRLGSWQKKGCWEWEFRRVGPKSWENPNTPKLKGLTEIIWTSFTMNKTNLTHGSHHRCDNCFDDLLICTLDHIDFAIDENNQSGHEDFAQIWQISSLRADPPQFETSSEQAPDTVLGAPVLGVHEAHLQTQASRRTLYPPWNGSG